MRLMHSKLGRIAAPVALALALGGSAYAFMASNTVSNSSAGVGSGTISGYQVSNISYQLSGANNTPSQITQVSFTLTPSDGTDPATSVAVWFDNNTSAVASTANNDCTIGAAQSNNAVSVTCNVTSLNQQAGPNSSTALNVAAAH
jgi:hypothetical protein